jgi:hypothetical protein
LERRVGNLPLAPCLVRRGFTGPNGYGGLQHHPVRRALRAAVCLIALLSGRVQAQLPGQPVGQGSGPVSELSTNIGAASRPVHQPGRSVRDAGTGRLSGNSVRGSVSGDLVSGPVSEISVGPVTANVPVTSSSVGESSSGAVKKDVNSPLGEMISQPLRELGALQEQLRAIQPLPRNTPLPSELEAEEAAAQAAAESAPGPPEEPQTEPEEAAEQAVVSDSQEGPAEVPEAAPMEEIVEPQAMEEAPLEAAPPEEAPQPQDSATPAAAAPQ